MRALRRIFVLLLPVLVLAACAPRRTGPAIAEERTTVRVENRSWNAVNVYALRGTQRIRLGMVPAVNTQVLTIPRSLVTGITTLAFLIDPIGSNVTPISQEITVREGDEVVLYVPNT